MQWRKFTRLKAATGHSRTRRMLCCGRRKENGRSVPDVTASPGRAPPGPLPANQMQTMPQRQGAKEPVLLQGDFRKVSGISSEIFRQIEAVENDHDPSTAAALEAVERRGEMIVRILEPRCIGGKQAVEAAQKLMAKGDARHSVQLVEIVKRPGQTLGLYIREGNGADRSDGVFISRIALESAVYNSGCLRVGDEILAVNLVDVTHMSLDDVVIIMSIPRRLVLAIRQRRGSRGANSPGPPPLTRPEQKPPPVVVIKRDIREEDLDDTDRIPRSRSSRERRTGDGREMTESRSRLGLGLNNYSPQSEQLDLYYNSRPNTISEPPSWGYKPPPPPSVITEQPKSHAFAPTHAYYQNAGTLESLAEKVHSFYPTPSRRMSTGTGVGMGQPHTRFPHSGSEQHLPRVDYGTDYSSSLGRHSLLRSSLKSSTMTSGGTLGRYGRYEPPRTSKYGTPPSGSASLTRRARPTLDYSSDTEATIGSRPSYYYYNRPAISSIPRGSASVLGGAADLAKFNSLPRDRPGIRLGGIRPRIGERLMDDSDDEYRAWLRRAPSSSAICDQMRLTRDILSQPRSHRFSCSAENIHDALKNTESIYSSRTGVLTGTLDRHLAGAPRGLSALPVRSLSSQHISGPASIRSPSIRRMRQLLELSTGPVSPASILSGHQSPAPTPSATLPRTHRQIDINPAEFIKYKLDKPVLDVGGISGMLWIHLLAGRGLRSAPETATQAVQSQIRDLYCVLECDRVHKARTVVRSGDLQFDWDESFELDLVCNKQLDVLVYSWDPQHRHKLCYRGAISLASLLRQSPLHQLALKVEPRGTIYIRLRHTDPVTLYRRRGLPSLRAGYPQLFGADLETVVNRESKGAPGSAPVPVVLRRCVEEVERRGLDIIGLYRLCGSATKKRLLREAFERNSRAVELSPEHVPDINVITGVLKDYLRELPEPLFTRCLFQMTVDALAVCLPDDPEGNAKLMLSILDCLPRANRATLVFLLDHLSLVVSASERNKMSAQALATVMGPPLMLHSSNAQPGSEIDHAQPIAVLKYLLQIWPQPQSTAAVSGRRGEPIGQRGNKASALQAAKLHPSSHRISPSVVSNQSPGQLHLSATPTSHQYQLVVDQLAQSPRVSPQVGQQPHQLGVSADSGMRDQSPLHGTRSPDSSSTSTGSESGSGTDTVKRGASPAISIISASNLKLHESPSSYSIKQYEQPDMIGRSRDIALEKSRNNGGSNVVSYGPTITLDTFPSARSALPQSSVSPSASIASSTSAVISSPSPLSIRSSSGNGSSPSQNQSYSLYSPRTAQAASGQIGGQLSPSPQPISTSNTGAASPLSSSSAYSTAASNASLARDYLSQLRGNNNRSNYSESSLRNHLGKQLQSSYSPTLSPSATSPSAATTTATSTMRAAEPSSHQSYRSQLSSSPSSSYQLSPSSVKATHGELTTSYSGAAAGTGAASSASPVATPTAASASDTSPSAASSEYKVSSPSRQITNINNTIPTSVARNLLLYQSDSSYCIKSQQPQQLQQESEKTNNFASSGHLMERQPASSGAATALYSNVGYNGSQAISTSMNIYGTLPKTSSSASHSGAGASTASSGFGPNATSASYSPSTHSEVHHQQVSGSTSGTGNGNNSSGSSYDLYSNIRQQLGMSGNGYHTLGSYRVQYSSTNPFLPSFDPPTGGDATSPVTSYNLDTKDNDKFDLK